jgi:hypothetical protein
VFELKIDSKNTLALQEWARHFRENYCLDAQIDRLRQGTKKSRSEYLIDLVFPDKSDDFGPATRSGDFAEILLADFLESHLDFWIPRVRYDDKLVRNESPKGTDVLGFKFASSDISKPSKNDVLIALEAKAQMSGGKATPRLQNAVDHSNKDVFRIAESLNAMKRRLLSRNDEQGATRVERFQNGIEVPFIRKSGAAAVLCSSVFDETHISLTTDCSGHENSKNLVLVVVHAADLMGFVHAFYARAADEA